MNIIGEKTNKKDYRFVYNSLNLVVFFKSEKTNKFVLENEVLRSLTNDIKQETDLFNVIPVGLESCVFLSIIKDSSLENGTDYIQYSFVGNKICHQYYEGSLNENFKNIVFTSVIDNRLNENIYKSFIDKKPYQLINYTTFNFLINTISKKSSTDFDSMRLARSVLYIRMILRTCYNDNIYSIKETLLDFQDLKKLVEYKEKTKNLLTKDLIEDYLNKLPNKCLFENEELNPLSCEDHGWNNLVFLEDLKNYKEKTFFKN